MLPGFPSSPRSKFALHPLTIACTLASSAFLLSACGGGSGGTDGNGGAVSVGLTAANTDNNAKCNLKASPNSAAYQACFKNQDPEDPPAPPVQRATCDMESMQALFPAQDSPTRDKPNTTVIAAKAFAVGDRLNLTGAVTGTAATVPLCAVKLVVGPGFKDPLSATAPSNSPGIGMEVWLPDPANWNGRIQNQGGGGWAGGSQANATSLGGPGNANTGWVVGSTDTGHSGGSFQMTASGGINSDLWEDFSERSLHQLALKTKALSLAYYGKEQDYAYWNGCSTGGRQGYKIAQEHPEDYDGYLVGAPAFNWTQFITSELYPQVVMQRDVGAVIAAAKLTAVSGRAVAACDVVGGNHLGFIIDPAQCQYDPTKDAGALCTSAGGTNATTSCVTMAEANAINKIWYGQTRDGSVPDPAVDNGSTPMQASYNHQWWGVRRGTQLSGLSGAAPFSIGSDMVALELQNPTLATTSFTNATGNGANGWRNLSYLEMAYAFDQGVALQPQFGYINTDNPDLSKARALGKKILSYHGLADTLITSAGSINYYTRVSDKLGGNAVVDSFNRLFLIPGMGHCAGVGTVSNTGGTLAATALPLPAGTQLFDALQAWVEKGTAPEQIKLASSNSSVTMPVCAYPKKATYSGTGDITVAESYSCK